MTILRAANILQLHWRLREHRLVSDSRSFDDLFENARTHRHWLGVQVPDSLIEAVYRRAVYGPTSLNCQPMRVVFVRTPIGKQRLKPALDEANVERTMSAPVTAIIGFDLRFADHLDRLLPGRNAAKRFDENADHRLETAMRNGTLQAAYLMLAARSFGLDVGPLSGFDRDLVNQVFFARSSITTNLLCNIGFGDHSRLSPRNPRLPFDEACTLA